MSELGTFSSAAKGLARNPLGIIALFIVLIYGFAALTLGINSTLQVEERAPLVWFLVVFPVIVLFTFTWLVSNHHEKLYAPGDYKTDDGFLEGMKAKVRHTSEIQIQQAELIKSKVREVLAAPSTPDEVQTQHFDTLMEKLSDEIDRATTLTVDARSFLNKQDALHHFPVAAFESLSELLDAIYFQLSPSVLPYCYGSSWWLRNLDSGEIIRNSGMIVGAKPGRKVPDTRALSDVGIKAGSRLIVERPA